MRLEPRAQFLRPWLALLAGAVLAACSGSDAPAEGAILITLDTTRADALGCYGGSPQVTPHLDALAKECVLYENARTVAPLTLPAHASMLTGLLPPRHGLHDNGIAVLPAAASTLAELAGARGVATAAVVSATVLDRAFGLDQGFESWQQPEPPATPLATRFGEFRAQEAVELARRWLSRRERGKPFFLWLHLFDPHVPYEPPAAFLRQAGGHPYLGEVAAMDAALGDFLAPLRADGTLDRTLLIVVADHGESLGEHGEPTHGALCYEPTVRVPLLVRFPGGRRAGERSGEPASVVDVFPTVAEALGLAAGGDLEGRSLWPGGRGSDRGQYLESYSGWLNYGWSPLAGWVEEGAKYLQSSSPELYRLESDPSEAHDLHDPSSPGELRARRAIAAIWSRAAPAAGQPGAFDQALLADLRRLGYGATGAPVEGLPSPLEPSERPSPRERAGELMALMQAHLLSEDGRFGEAVELVRAILLENPGNCLALEALASDLMQLGAFAEALDAWERRLACGGERADTWLNLGLCRERLGDQEAGLEALRRALAIDAGHPQVRAELALMLERAGLAAEAAEVRGEEPGGR